MSTADPLRELIIDAVEVDRQRIADALRGVVAIDKSGSVTPLEAFQRLSAQQKILAFLLARKVAVLLDLAEEEAIQPNDLAQHSGVAPGTVRPTVRRLHDARLISQDVDSGYYLSPHQVGTAIRDLVEPTEDALAASTPARSNRTRRRVRKVEGKRVTPKVPTQDGEASESPQRTKRARASTEFSPTQAVRDLYDRGFFDSGKTLADIQRRLKDKQGRDVKITTLSPVLTRLLRAGLLDRVKNDDGTYVYSPPEA